MSTDSPVGAGLVFICRADETQTPGHRDRSCPRRTRPTPPWRGESERDPFGFVRIELDCIMLKRGRRLPENRVQLERDPAERAARPRPWLPGVPATASTSSGEQEREFSTWSIGCNSSRITQPRNNIYGHFRNDKLIVTQPLKTEKTKRSHPRPFSEPASEAT